MGGIAWESGRRFCRLVVGISKVLSIVTRRAERSRL